MFYVGDHEGQGSLSLKRDRHMFPLPAHRQQGDEVKVQDALRAAQYDLASPLSPTPPPPPIPLSLPPAPPIRCRVTRARCRTR